MGPRETLIDEELQLAEPLNKLKGRKCRASSGTDRLSAAAADMRTGHIIVIFVVSSSQILPL